MRSGAGVDIFKKIKNSLQLLVPSYAFSIFMNNQGPIWFLFLKTVFCPQKQGKQEHVLFPVFFCYEKAQRTQKILKLDNKNNFQRTPKSCSLCFQKQELSQAPRFCFLFRKS